MPLIEALDLHAQHPGIGGNFVVFIYEGRGENPGTSVDSLLLTEANIPAVLRWLQENLPINSCWSLAVVEEPKAPTADSDLCISWVVGADVFNLDPRNREPEWQRLAEEMLARRHRVNLP